jgi:hypothetical protein
MTKHFLMYFSLFWAMAVQAAPPEVKPTYEVVTGQNVRINVKSDVEIGYVASFSDEQAFFEELIPKAGERRFVFQSMKDGYYVIAFWTKGETTGVMTMITVGKPNTKPGDPPKDPPGTTPSEKINYLLIVRKDTSGGADPEYTKIMQSPAWKTLSAKGILIKDKTASEARLLGYTVPSTLPAVFSLYDNGTKSKILAGPVNLPTTDDTILKLVP